MKSRYGLLGASIAALMAFGAIAATSAPAPKVTGGGQTLTGTEGAGDTIALTAQGSGNAVRGQVQYVDREPNTPQDVFHGIVECLVYEGPNGARLGGTWNGGGTFEIALVDNGQGTNSSDDLIDVFPTATPDCVNDQSPSDDATTALARGNVELH